jgi:hypothetical protein
MTPSIFISSTYNDLVPYRESIWQVLSDLNFSIKGMEKFGARKSCPLDTCLLEVSKSDVYIGILAYRYGSVDSVTGKSFTQLEYEKALAMNKNILIYIIDSNGFIQGKHIDFGENAVKLDLFKRDLQRNHTVDFFKDPIDLKIKIYEKLKALYPDISKQTFQLKNLECTLTRFDVGDEKWMAFLGFYGKTPLEIYSGLADEEIFPIPKSIIKGTILKITDVDGRSRIDFQYTDKYGYKKTIGGINHMFLKQISTYNSIINKLLQNEMPVMEIVSIINDMDIHEISTPGDWKKGIIKALNESYG